MLGLCLAYVATTLWLGGGTTPELKLFAVFVSCWILVASLHGLYHRDEERADHCTTDDIVGVLHVVTIASWLVLVASRLNGFAGPGVAGLLVF